MSEPSIIGDGGWWPDDNEDYVPTDELRLIWSFGEGMTVCVGPEGEHCNLAFIPTELLLRLAALASTGEDNVTERRRTE